MYKLNSRLGRVSMLIDIGELPGAMGTASDLLG